MCLRSCVCLCVFGLHVNVSSISFMRFIDFFSSLNILLLNFVFYHLKRFDHVYHVRFFSSSIHVHTYRVLFTACVWCVNWLTEHDCVCEKGRKISKHEAEDKARQQEEGIM